MRDILRTCAVVLSLAASPCIAHAFLDSASPAVGSTGAAPSQLVLHFTEEINPASSGVALSGPTGKVDVGSGHSLEGDDTALVFPLIKLPAGVYNVQWHAVSLDSHHTQGNFSFTVK